MVLKNESQGQLRLFIKRGWTDGENARGSRWFNVSHLKDPLFYFPSLAYFVLHVRAYMLSSSARVETSNETKISSKPVSFRVHICKIEMFNLRQLQK